MNMQCIDCLRRYFPGEQMPAAPCLVTSDESGFHVLLILYTKEDFNRFFDFHTKGPNSFMGTR